MWCSFHYLVSTSVSCQICLHVAESGPFWSRTSNASQGVPAIRTCSQLCGTWPTPSFADVFQTALRTLRQICPHRPWDVATLRSGSLWDIQTSWPLEWFSSCTCPHQQPLLYLWGCLSEITSLHIGPTICDVPDCQWRRSTQTDRQRQADFHLCTLLQGICDEAWPPAASTSISRRHSGRWQSSAWHRWCALPDPTGYRDWWHCHLVRERGCGFPSVHWVSHLPSQIWPQTRTATSST